MNLRIRGEFGHATFNGLTYLATEMIFYRESEHTFGTLESRLDMEMQVVHRTEHNQILVVVMFYRLNNTNSMFMDQLDLLQVSGMHSGDSRNMKSVIDLSLMLNGVRQMVSYEGSLSRPPCTPNVNYLVITNIKRISQAFLDAFPDDLVGNYRQTQDREDRALTLINYRGGVSTTLSQPPPIRSQSPRATFNPIYDHDKVQGFRLNPDTDILVDRHSPYPIVGEINVRLPFPEFVPFRTPSMNRNVENEVETHNEEVTEDDSAAEDDATSVNGTTAEDDSSPDVNPSTENSEHSTSEETETPTEAQSNSNTSPPSTDSSSASPPTEDPGTEDDAEDEEDQGSRIQQSVTPSRDDEYKKKLNSFQDTDSENANSELSSQWIADTSSQSIIQH